jgi:hypothetical protein
MPCGAAPKNSQKRRSKGQLHDRTNTITNRIIRRSALLVRYCAEIGRDLASVTRSICLPISYDQPSITQGAIGKAMLAAAISFQLVPPVAWITVVGRGYMPPLGFAIATLALGNLFSKTGWAEWFPWSIVPALIGMVGNRLGPPVGAMWAIAATFAVGSQLRCAAAGRGRAQWATRRVSPLRPRNASHSPLTTASKCSTS